MSDVPPDAGAVIELLGLQAHPEGGWYAQTWRDEASSAIWFLLKATERSHWHRVHGSSEVWHHYLGDPLRLDVAGDSPSGGPVTSTILGPDLAAGHRPQAVVGRGEWQAATPVVPAAGAVTPTLGYTLVGCTVAPPFTFDNFELAPPNWSPTELRPRV